MTVTGLEKAQSHLTSMLAMSSFFCKAFHSGGSCPLLEEHRSAPFRHSTSITFGSSFSTHNSRGVSPSPELKESGRSNYWGLHT